MSSEDYENNAEFLVDSLPTYFPKNEETNNYKLLQTIANRIDELENYTQHLNNATTVQHADTNAQLREHGKAVNLRRKRDESREKYRARLIGEYQLLTCEATPKDIINSAATIINTSPESIHYTEYRSDEENSSIGIFAHDLDKVELTETEVAEVLSKLVPAGYNVSSFVRGTFEIGNKIIYEEDIHDTSKAVSGLDENGEPIEEYGTISGLIN